MTLVRDWHLEFELDPEDAALLNHVYDDDKPPQGLHQGGVTRAMYGAHERWEDEAIDDFLYPWDDDDLGV